MCVQVHVIKVGMVEIGWGDFSAEEDLMTVICLLKLCEAASKASERM